MITTSESTKELSAAMAAAQAKIDFAAKDTANPFFKSKYADLASVWTVLQPALSASGLSVSQSPGYESVNGRDFITITTRVMHSSGEWMQGVCHMPVGKTDAQAYGSAITYGRRYALSAFFGVVQDDDDGNAASNRGAERQEQKQSPASKPPAKKESAAKPAKKQTAPEDSGSNAASNSGNQATEDARMAEVRNFARFLTSMGAKTVEDYDTMLYYMRSGVIENPKWAEIKENPQVDLADIKSEMEQWLKINATEVIDRKDAFAVCQRLAEMDAVHQ